jgi:hypothetical protein
VLPSSRPYDTEPGVSTLAGAARHIGQPGAVPSALVTNPPLASPRRMSLSLPYVRGRPVIRDHRSRPEHRMAWRWGGTDRSRASGVQTPVSAAIASAGLRPVGLACTTGPLVLPEVQQRAQGGAVSPAWKVAR